MRSNARLALVLFPILAAAAAQAQLDQTITYQGVLKSDGIPANGTYDLIFVLFADAQNPGQIGACQCLNDVPVVNGLFTVKLNDTGQFGPSAFNGEERWIEVRVKADTTPGATQRRSPIRWRVASNMLL